MIDVDPPRATTFVPQGELPQRRSLLAQLRRAITTGFMRWTESRRPYRYRTLGKDLVIAPGIGYPTNLFLLHRFNFAYSEFLAVAIDVRPGDAVLEIGTGCGLIALCAAERASRVVATDINPCSLACARENFVRNGATGIETRLGDLFEPVGAERFDLIVWHLPYYLADGPLADDSSLHFHLGTREAMRRFASEADRHLRPGGRVQFALGRVEDTSFVLEAWARAGFRLRAEAKRWQLGFLEGEVVWRAERLANLPSPGALKGAAA